MTEYFRKNISERLSVKELDAVTQKMIFEAWNKESTIIIQKLKSIRHVKRFFNIFMFRYPKVKNDVNINDFLLLTLLRYKDINVYYAIVNGNIVSTGDSITGKSDVIYLHNNYTEELMRISTWGDCKEILEELFPKKEDIIFSSDEANHIRWINNFDQYFYDYKIGNVNYVDLLKLLKETKDNEAFTLIDKMLQNNQEQELEKFLTSNNIKWISKSETLIRLFKLLEYTDTIKNKEFHIKVFIIWLLRKETINEAKTSGVIADTNTYKNIIYDAIRQMVEFRPNMLGSFIINSINSLLSETTYENPYIFSHQELTDIALLCQKYYYSKFGTDNWDYVVAFNLCKIIGPKERELYDYAARVELFSLMKEHPDDFAQNIIIYQVSDDKKTLSLQFIQSFEVKKIFPIDNQSFEDWLTLLSDKTTAEVIKRIYEKALSNNILQIPALHDAYRIKDMIAFKKAIDAEDKRIQTDKILSECNTNFVVDLTMLAKNTNINKEDIKEILTKLVNAGKLTDRYLHLKDSIEPLEPEDYVRLKKATYENLQKKPPYTNNVFKIRTIDKNKRSIEVYDIDSKLGIGDVEPIPIDGDADKDIFMSIYPAPGQHKTDYTSFYYMNAITILR